MTPLEPMIKKAVDDIDAEIRALQNERESIIEGNSHFRCATCDWYCQDLDCNEEHVNA